MLTVSSSSIENIVKDFVGALRDVLPFFSDFRAVNLIFLREAIFKFELLELFRYLTPRPSLIACVNTVLLAAILRWTVDTLTKASRRDTATVLTSRMVEFDGDRSAISSKVITQVSSARASGEE